MAQALPPWSAVSGVLDLPLLFQLVLASVLGGAIGLERELAGKPAGLRTNILICVGAALFMHLSVSVAEIAFTPDGGPFGDTTRIAAQIVSGIGFLGAGAILHAHGTVVGLTTAATIWVVAAVGAAIGAGQYVEGVGTTALMVVVLVGLRPLEHRLLLRRRRAHLTLRVRAGAGFDAFAQLIRAAGVHIAQRATFEHDTDRAFELELVGTTRQFDVMQDALRRAQDIVSITLD